MEQLRELGITHVLNVTCHHPPRAETEAALCVVHWPLEVRMRALPKTRAFSEQDAVTQDMVPYLKHSFHLIESGMCVVLFAQKLTSAAVRTRGGRILVHCSLGVSRSATLVCVCVSFLNPTLTHTGRSLRDAVQERGLVGSVCHGQRSCCCCCFLMPSRMCVSDRRESGCGSERGVHAAIDRGRGKG